MASYSQKLILVALILTITISVSTAHRRSWRNRSPNSDDTEHYLRDLCSETDRSDVCLSIIKSNSHRFDNSDDGDIVSGVIDLAIERSNEIGDQLNRWYEDTNDDQMREKYRSCSENYDEASSYLEDAQRNFDSDDYRRISDQIDDAREELNRCRSVFGSGSFDPGHVEDRNNEFGVYLDMIRAAEGRLGYDD